MFIYAAFLPFKLRGFRISPCIALAIFPSDIGRLFST
jgi:hypothetical protein